MENFASAAMLRLLLRGMAVQGLTTPMAEPGSAHVPLPHKRQLVATIVEAGGWPLLLRLAQGVHHIQGEAIYQALVGARDVPDFLARWQRMERYLHSHHRVRVLAQSASGLCLVHTSRLADQAAPLPAESLAVLGVWIGALQAVGVAGLRVVLGSVPVHPDLDETGLQQLVAAGPLPTWQLHWSPGLAWQPPGNAHGDRLGAPAPGLGAPLPWGEPANALALWLARNSSQPPRLASAAAALGLSPRSLQRQLQPCGISFSALVAQVRVRLAAAWLTQTRHGLAEIGYRCGYADQPHFTREFSRLTGLAPQRYRQAAAPPPHGGLH